MKKLLKKLSSIFTFLCIIVTLMPSTIAFASTGGKMTTLTDIGGGSGSTVYVYEPANPSTNALMTPIVILYGHKDYSNGVEASAVLESSGIKALADEKVINVDKIDNLLRFFSTSEKGIRNVKM